MSFGTKLAMLVQAEDSPLPISMDARFVDDIALTPFKVRRRFRFDA
jgi:hypothetical protein